MNRVDALRRVMNEQGLTALLVTNVANCRYLSGFTGTDVSLVITPAINGIAVDPRYVVQAQSQCPDWTLIGVHGDIATWFPAVALQSKVGEWGVESDSLSLLNYQRLMEAFASSKNEIHLRPVHGLVQKLRVLKQLEELTGISAACRLVDEALSEALTGLHAGVTEKQLAWQVECAIRNHGSGCLPFEIIVASGSNSSMPHASPSDKIIGSGEPIIIDCGARIDGYCSDITRTYCLGEPSDKLKSVYTAVLGAQETVLSTIVPGMTGGEVDLMARSVLKECDLDGYFQHGLGHGVGLEIHELPRLGIHSEDILLQSTVFTVEPGVYIPGWGGVRIEDTVLMEAGGGRSLTKSKKDLTLLYVEG